jgi:hypothetical protein
LFSEFAGEAEIGDEVIEIISQMGFIEALSLLEMEFSQVEMECLLGVLSKP